MSRIQFPPQYIPQPGRIDFNLTVDRLNSPNILNFTQSLNITVVTPPPLVFNPYLYDLQENLQLYHQRNPRPVTTPHFTGPLAREYVSGLLIVPLFLLGFFVLWTLVVILVSSIIGKCCACDGGCRENHDEEGARVCCCGLCPKACEVGCDKHCGAEKCKVKQGRPDCCNRKVSFAFFVLTMLISTISWALSIAYAVRVQNFTTSQQAFNTLTNSFATINAEVANITQDLIALNASVNFLLNACVMDGVNYTLPAAPIVGKFLNGMTNYCNQAIAISNDLKHITEFSYYVVYLITVILGSIQLLLAVFLIGFVSFKNLKPSRKDRRSEEERCVRRCCYKMQNGCFCMTETLLVCLALLNLFSCILVAAGFHAISLFQSDLCYPDINNNLNSIAADYLNYAPTNQSLSVCGNVQLQVSPTPPLTMQLMCYYQTCELPAAMQSTLLSGYVELKDYLYSLYVALAAIPLSSLPKTCRGNVAASASSALQIYASTLQIIASLTCPSINPVYATLAYQSFCDEVFYLLYSTMCVIVVGSFFLMAASLIYLIADLGKTPKEQTEARRESQKLLKIEEEEDKEDNHIVQI